MHNDNIVIRPYKSSDYASIKMLLEKMFGYHIGLDPIFEQVKNQDNIFEKYAKGELNPEYSNILVAADNDKVIGYILGIIQERYYPNPKTGSIHNISVLEEYQKMGIGERLNTGLLEWFKSRDVEQVELFAAVNNPKAMGFWGKMGYNPYVVRMFKTIK
ncbi:MAG: GNAT family N-acetyltransferase [Brevinematales bacterium]|jgi:ribosomal protein S18 acetylase RimI-like enzyme